MDSEIWTELYNRAGTPELHNVLTGFNVNLDRIIQVSHELLESPALVDGELRELRSRLIHSMELCTAEEWFVSDRARYTGYLDYFSEAGPLTVGGQAGIAAVHLASLHIPVVICTAPSLGGKTREILTKSGVQVLGDSAPGQAALDSIHLVFEYKPGLVPLAGGALTRDNRFIASPGKSSGNTLLSEKSLADVLCGISSCTRAFLSGYQYLQGEGEFYHAARQIRAIKANNPAMKVHIECVSVTEARVIAGIVHHILPSADSAGMNEHELSLMLNDIRGVSGAGGTMDTRTAPGLVHGMVALAKETGLARVHLHTFGFYLLVIKKDCGSPEKSRAALLYAAQVVATAAGGTGTRISPAGLAAVGQIRQVFGKEQAHGIFLHEGYYLIIIPTLIAENISKTSGLGDILSSTAFVADPF
jgi:ADP-dependent phosphofructokinase/glucokinase